MKNNQNNENNKIILRMIITAIVFVGALNTSTAVFGYDFIEKFSDYFNKLLKTNYNIRIIICVLIGISVIYLFFDRTTWLPFLGKSVMPHSLIPLKQLEKYDKTIEIKVTPNTKVAYWSSMPSNTELDVNEAYGDYLNSGVIMSDNDGIAKLNFMTGNSYAVPMGKIIPRHIHYREILKENSMMGEIKTIYY